jgi:hypothetical protein
MWAYAGGRLVRKDCGVKDHSRRPRAEVSTHALASTLPHRRLGGDAVFSRLLLPQVLRLAAPLLPDFLL